MKVLMFVASACLASSMAFAADTENSKSTTVDHSKNPITGTKKTVVETKVKKTAANGAEVESTTTDTTKVTKDGKVTKKHESESDSTTH